MHRTASAVRAGFVCIGNTKAAMQTGRLMWLPHKDSNLDKLIQSQLCYRYTMRQREVKRVHYAKLPH